MMMMMVVQWKYVMKRIYFGLRVRIYIQLMSMAHSSSYNYLMFQSLFWLSDNGLNVLLVFFFYVFLKS